MFMVQFKCIKIPCIWFKSTDMAALDIYSKKLQTKNTFCDVLLRGFEAPSTGFDDKCKLTITKHLRVQKLHSNASQNTAWPSVSAMVVKASLSGREAQQS